MSAAAGIAHPCLCRVFLAASLLALCGCARPGSHRTIEPPVPLSNVSADMVNPDGTLKKNGLAPADPSEQR